MKKFPKIKRLGHRDNAGIIASQEDVYAQEKMDGANFRFTLAKHVDGVERDGLVFGSRNVIYKNERDIDSTFSHAIEYIEENIDMEEVKFIDEIHGPLTFYGEAMHPHTLDYDWENTPSFLGFDVYSEQIGEFWHPYETRFFFGEMNLPTAPLLNDVFIDGEMDIPESKYMDGEAEGVVIKNYKTGQRAKLRSEEFKEMHGSSGGASGGGQESEDSYSLARQFATEARILKQIHKYENRGEVVEMGIMDELWQDVFEDIIEEEYDTIFLGNHTIDTKDFRSEIASQTAEVLQQYLSRPNESVLNEATA